MGTWALQDAENQLSELVRRAIGEGPQEVTIEGESAVTLISTRELQRLRVQSHSLVEFLSASPIRGLDVPLRDNDAKREVSL